MLFHHQRTIRNTVQCRGHGLHSGSEVTMTVRPAPAHQGIIFHRQDVADRDPIVMAHYDCVSETQLGTTLTNMQKVSVATVEHLMAALSGLGIDNATVELSGPEVPIMDGSAEPFVFLLECAGTVKQEALRPYIRVRRPVRVQVGEAWASLTPHDGFVVDVHIAFDNRVISEQKARVDFAGMSFKNTLCRARTFGFEEDVEKLRQMGLAKGGSLENAVVVGSDRVLNSEGLRYTDEFVRHKMLDCVGDLYLAGAQILGRFDGYRTGHGVNNRLLRELFAEQSAWERIHAADMPPASVVLGRALAEENHAPLQ